MIPVAPDGAVNATWSEPSPGVTAVIVGAFATAAEATFGVTAVTANAKVDAITATAMNSARALTCALRLLNFSASSLQALGREFRKTSRKNQIAANERPKPKGGLGA